MNFIDDAKKLISNKEVKGKSKNLIEDLLNAILGNPISAAKVLLTVIESPYFIREKLFLVKLERFLNGIYQQESDIEKLKYQLALKEDKQENAKRILYCIDKVETDKKVDYLINVTRTLINDIIDLSTYFRICNVVVNTLDEDLKFLAEHIKETDINYSLEVNGLLRSGLINPNLANEGYSFNSLAKFVDKYAINFENRTRYPNLEEKPEIKEPARMFIASDKESNEILGNYF